MVNYNEKIDQYKSLIEAFADPYDGIIYHYTSAEGLKGIIENSEIWLTNTAFVNDTTECKALQEESGLFNNTDFKNKYVKKAWKKFIDNHYTDSDTYIVSFSEKENLLSQFRAYGNFCIGFEAENLIRGPFNFYCCVYENAKIKNWILEKEKVRQWEGGSLDKDRKDAAAYHLIYIASRKFKNMHFSNEKEVRLIAVSNSTWGNSYNSPSMFENDPPIHYRNHPKYKMPVPYVKFMITDRKPGSSVKETERQMKERKLSEEKTEKRELLPIKEIWIGPMLYQEEARIACDILLKDKGYKNVKVNVSDIPYRG